MDPVNVQPFRDLRQIRNLRHSIIAGTTAQFDPGTLCPPFSGTKSTCFQPHEYITRSDIYDIRTKFAQSRASENLAERERNSGLRPRQAVQRFPSEPREYGGVRAPSGERRIFNGEQLAETEGFEPSIRCNTYDDLANRCLQPLGHVSGIGAFAAIWAAMQARSRVLISGFGGFGGFGKLTEQPLFELHQVGGQVSGRWRATHSVPGEFVRRAHASLLAGWSSARAICQSVLSIPRTP